MKASDLEKAEVILTRPLGDSAWMGSLKENIALALAAERASLPESVERALKQTTDHDDLDMGTAKRALEDLRKWKAGE